MYTSKKIPARMELRATVISIEFSTTPHKMAPVKQLPAALRVILIAAFPAKIFPFSNTIGPRYTPYVLTHTVARRHEQTHKHRHTNTDRDSHRDRDRERHRL